MKAILIKGIEMPSSTEDGLTTFLDARIYSDGEVLIPCMHGNCSTVRAEQIEIEEG